MSASPQGLAEFIDASPSPFHVCATVADRLRAAGFRELSEGAGWRSAAGGESSSAAGGESSSAAGGESSSAAGGESSSAAGGESSSAAGGESSSGGSFFTVR